MITTYFRIKTPFGHVAPGTPAPHAFETAHPLAARLFYPRAQAEAFLDDYGGEGWEIEERPLRHEPEPTPAKPI